MGITQGKWEIHKTSHPLSREYWITSNQNVIARVVLVNTDPDEAKANAQAIATIPELLAALTKISKAEDKRKKSCGYDVEIDEIAKVAIKQAKTK